MRVLLEQLLAILDYHNGVDKGQIARLSTLRERFTQARAPVGAVAASFVATACFGH